MSKKFDLEAYKIKLEEYKKLPNIGIVYLIENKINGKQYVGQTTKTFKIRLKQHSVADSLLGKAIRKYGLENFEYCIFRQAKTIEELNRLEIETIKYLDTLVPNGYNILLGGLGAINRVPWNKNKKGLQKAWNKDLPNLKAAKPVIGENLVTKELLRFNSAMEAERLGNFHNSWIIQCCKGKQTQHKGYIWRYANGS